MPVTDTRFRQALSARAAHTVAAATGAKAEPSEYPTNTVELNAALQAQTHFISGKIKVEPKTKLADLLKQIESSKLDDISREKLLDLLKLTKAKSERKEEAQTITGILHASYEHARPGYINENLLNSLLNFIGEELKGDQDGMRRESLNIAEYAKTSKEDAIYSQLANNICLVKLKNILVQSSLGSHLKNIEANFLARINDTKLNDAYKDCGHLREQLASLCISKSAKLLEKPIIINGIAIQPLTLSQTAMQTITGNPEAQTKTFDIKEIVATILKAKDQEERSEAVKKYILYHTALAYKASSTIVAADREADHRQRIAIETLMSSDRYLGEIKPYFQSAMRDAIAIIGDNDVNKAIKHLDRTNESLSMTDVNQRLVAAGIPTTAHTRVDQFALEVQEAFDRNKQLENQGAKEVLNNYTQHTDRATDDERSIKKVQYITRVMSGEDTVIDLIVAKKNELITRIASGVNDRGTIDWSQPKAIQYATELGLQTHLPHLQTLATNPAQFSDYLQTLLNDTEFYNLASQCQRRSTVASQNTLDNEIKTAAEEFKILSDIQNVGEIETLKATFCEAVQYKLFKEGDIKDLSIHVTDNPILKHSINTQLSSYPHDPSTAQIGIRNLIDYLYNQNDRDIGGTAAKINSILDITDGGSFADTKENAHTIVAEKITHMYNDLSNSTADKYDQARQWLSNKINTDHTAAPRHEFQAETQSHLDFVLNPQYQDLIGENMRIIGLAKIIEQLSQEPNKVKQTLVLEYLENQLGLKFRYGIMNTPPYPANAVNNNFAGRFQAMVTIDKQSEVLQQASTKTANLAGRSLASIYLPIFDNRIADLQAMSGQLTTIREQMITTHTKNELTAFARTRSMPSNIITLCSRLDGTYDDRSKPYGTQLTDTGTACEVIDGFIKNIVHKVGREV